jgi:pimeloyl-ACP methyl ester carboxylesterase
MATAELHVNGTTVRIGYDDTGGDGPAVLFSHGFLMDRTMFAVQVQDLSDTYRCVSWDERGFGETEAPGPFTYWDSAADAVALLDHLGIERAAFVGMSQGGFLSLRAALASPDRVAGICLIDSAADTDDEDTLAGYRQMLDALTGDDDDTWEAVAQIVAGLILGDPALEAEWLPKWRARRGTTDLRIPGETLLGRDDISDRLGEIRCPVLSIHGTDDQAVSLERGRAVQERVPNPSGLVEIQGAAHAPNMTHPDQVNPALRGWLATL